jgi:hypothetical protein
MTLIEAGLERGAIFRLAVSGQGNQQRVVEVG